MSTVRRWRTPLRYGAWESQWRWTILSGGGRPAALFLHPYFFQDIRDQKLSIVRTHCGTPAAPSSINTTHWWNTKDAYLKTRIKFKKVSFRFHFFKRSPLNLTELLSSLNYCHVLLLYLILFMWITKIYQDIWFITFIDKTTLFTLYYCIQEKFYLLVFLELLITVTEHYCCFFLKLVEIWDFKAYKIRMAKYIFVNKHTLE